LLSIHSVYHNNVPKLWTDTLETHRRAVRDAVVESAADLVGRRGIRSVTMSEIAEKAGVGRATLYKYFRDVEAILLAWHERQVTGHLARIAEACARPGTARERIVAVLEAYALVRHESRGHGELAAFLHQGEHVLDAERRVREIIGALITEGAAAGELRGDVPPDELAAFCVHALSASVYLPSRTAVRRLVGVTLDALSPSPAA
jgi:AcrR family transcriptional regulator